MSVGAVFGGLYVFGSETLVYIGLAGLVIGSLSNFWTRRRAENTPTL